MSIFALRKLDEVKNGKLSFYKLEIEGECQYDEFCKEVESHGTYVKALNTIRTFMNFMAENPGKKLPSEKFNSIKEKNNVIGYEFKKDSLRVYVLKREPDMYVVLGGYKTEQKKDISAFKRIIPKLETSTEEITFY